MDPTPVGRSHAALAAGHRRTSSPLLADRVKYTAVRHGDFYIGLDLTRAQLPSVCTRFVGVGSWFTVSRWELTGFFHRFSELELQADLGEARG
jgi:hypothetical protein